MAVELEEIGDDAGLLPVVQGLAYPCFVAVDMHRAASADTVEQVEGWAFAMVVAVVAVPRTPVLDAVPVAAAAVPELA